MLGKVSCLLKLSLDIAVLGELKKVTYEIILNKHGPLIWSKKEIRKSFSTSGFIGARELITRYSFLRHMKADKLLIIPP